MVAIWNAIKNNLKIKLWIFGGLIWMLWHMKNAYETTKQPRFIVGPAWMELTTSSLRQHRQLPVVQHVRFMPLKLCKIHNPNDMSEAALHNWQSVWNAYNKTIYMHPMICCFNFKLNFDSKIFHKKHMAWLPTITLISIAVYICDILHTLFTSHRSAWHVRVINHDLHHINLLSYYWKGHLFSCWCISIQWYFYSPLFSDSQYAADSGIIL